MRKLLLSEKLLVIGLLITVFFTIKYSFFYFFVLLSTTLIVSIFVYFVERVVFNTEGIPYVLTRKEISKFLDKESLWSEKKRFIIPNQVKIGKILFVTGLVLTVPGFILSSYGYLNDLMGLLEAITFWLMISMSFLLVSLLGLFFIFYKGTGRNTVIVFEEGLFFDKYFIPWKDIQSISLDSKKTSNMLRGAANLAVRLSGSQVINNGSDMSVKVIDVEGRVFRISILDTNSFKTVLGKKG